MVTLRDTLASKPITIPSPAIGVNTVGYQYAEDLLSLAMRASVSPIRMAAGLGLVPRPSVMYPVRPVKAPIALALAEVVTGRGVEMSVADIEETEKIA